jgi:hypothetical protein
MAKIVVCSRPLSDHDEADNYLSRSLKTFLICARGYRAHNLLYERKYPDSSHPDARVAYYIQPPGAGISSRG